MEDITRHNCRIFLLVLTVTSIVFAQAPDIQWTKVYGGSNNDYSRAIQLTSDGGYIITGFTYSFGAGLDDVYLIKTDSLGDTLWTKTYGGNVYDASEAIGITNDGGFIITGLADCHSPFDGMLYLLRTDSLGDTIWTRKFGGTSVECGFSTQQTADGGFIVLGFTYSFGPGYSGFYLIKTDSLGDSLWTKTYGGLDWEFGESIDETTNGGFIMTGGTTSYGAGGQDIYLVKTNQQGDTLWTKTFGDTINEWGNSVLQTTDGGYIITGYTNSLGVGDHDIYVIKTDSLGEVLWIKNYGATNRSEVGECIIECLDGGYCIVGVSRPYPTGNSDICILKTDERGDTLWTKTISGSESDKASSIKQTTDGGYIICGHIKDYYSDKYSVYLLKLFPDTLNIEEYKSQCIKNDYVLTTILTGSFQFPIDKPYKIYDITGRQIHTLNPAPGIYFIEVDGKIRQKVVKIR